ncbi:hypothetical protein QTN25_008093 [Entamoeba marina]
MHLLSLQMFYDNVKLLGLNLERAAAQLPYFSNVWRMSFKMDIDTWLSLDKQLEKLPLKKKGIVSNKEKFIARCTSFWPELFSPSKTIVIAGIIQADYLDIIRNTNVVGNIYFDDIVAVDEEFEL